jgi:hypothetical protein
LTWLLPLDVCRWFIRFWKQTFVTLPHRIYSPEEIYFALSLSPSLLAPPSSHLLAASHPITARILGRSLNFQQWSRTMSRTFSFILRSWGGAKSLIDHNCLGGRKLEFASHSLRAFSSSCSPPPSFLPWPGYPYYRVTDIPAVAYRLRLERRRCRLYGHLIRRIILPESMRARLERVAS